MQQQLPRVYLLGNLVPTVPSHRQVGVSEDRDGVLEALSNMSVDGGDLLEVGVLVTGVCLEFHQTRQSSPQPSPWTSQTSEAR